jgi:hypothetical protein
MNPLSQRRFIYGNIKLIKTLVIFIIILICLSPVALWIYRHLYPTPFSQAKEIILKKDGYPYFRLSLREGRLIEVLRKTRALWGNRKQYFMQTAHHLYVRTGRSSYRYDIQEDGSLYSYEPIWHLFPGTELKELLRKELDNLEEAIREKYGELIPWEEAKELFPLMGYATVIDFNTRLSFRVQRRAGPDHADVQPLTREDKAIMKKIFGGVWSWNRRAIIVDTGSRRIAASMNGQPHGAGAIQDNNFPGHFCIHFYKSTTHSHHLDPDHIRMVLRAAGKIR